MRIGIVHSFYRDGIPSGENMTVQAIQNILKDVGHDVTMIGGNTSNLAKSNLLQVKELGNIFLPKRKSNLDYAILGKQNSIQIHNPFPRLTIADMKAIQKMNIRVTCVIHNYRFSCLTGNHFRENALCFKCTKNSSIPGIMRGCYNDSRLRSSVYASYYGEYRRFTLSSNADFIAISPHIAEYLRSLDIEPEKIHVIPNSIEKNRKITPEASEAIFLSRLEQEKGVRAVVEAWIQNPQLPPINIVGSGSMERWVRDAIVGKPNIKYHGYLQGDALEKIVARSKVLVAPLFWDEPFGRVIVESFSRGQAVVTTPRGIALTHIEPGVNGYFLNLNATDLVEKINLAFKIPFNIHFESGIRIWESFYSTENVKNSWEKFYPL